MSPNGGAVPPQLRIDYRQGTLIERDAAADPIEQFARWFSEAQGAGIPEPNAMSVATADTSCKPSVRICLLKEFDARGFVFYTNYLSRKGAELSLNPQVALCFHWQPLERQVRIEGIVQKVGRQESDEYFHSRPVSAQIGAWVSNQSEVLASREELDRKEAQILEKFGAGPVPLPDYWGGYRVLPLAIEFWQGRASRLHDRLLYTRVDVHAKAWKLQRLSP